MSTYWDIHCLDCNDGAGFWCNHGEQELARLWSVRDHFLNFEEVQSAVDIEMSFLRDEHGAIRSFPLFVKTHKTHNVVIRNEYGGVYGRCSKWLKCSECGHGGSCNRPMGHEGDCGLKAV